MTYRDGTSAPDKDVLADLRDYRPDDITKVIAVTGGSGFIGRYVCEIIGRYGHVAIPIDRSSDRESVDVRDGSAVSAHLAGCDAVIHLAGVLGTSELFADADRAVDVNIKGTMRVLEACRADDMVYVGITMPDCWRNLYQATKFAALRIAESYAESYGLRVAHVRAFNAFGEGQAYGQGHPQKIIPTFASRSWAGLPIPIWGDGEQTVDLVHASYVAETLVRVAVAGLGPDRDQNPDWPNGRVVDAGAGVETRVIDVARMVGEITGRTVVEFLPMREGETAGTKLCAKRSRMIVDPGDQSRLLRETVESYMTAPS